MIRLLGLQLARAGRVLLDNASQSIEAGQRVAILGPNGCGKSTLFDALMTGDAIEQGSIDRPAGWRVICLEQQVLAGESPAWLQVFEADPELYAAYRATQEAKPSDDDAQANAELAWHEAQGPAAIARCKQLLAGLGFSVEQIESSVQALSGGWRMRVNLARALFAPSELLLLDEPTNHLDLDAILWLERWLLRYEGTVMVISHDREFIDRVAQISLAFESGQMVRYGGGYSQMESTRVQRLMEQQRKVQKTEQKAAALQTFIDRFRAKATKARQVQSRIKALEKLQTSAVLAQHSGAPSITLAQVGHCPDPLINLVDAQIGYQQPLLSAVEVQLRKGARVGVLGRNGAGKSTLIKSLIGELAILDGELTRANSLRVGYFAQNAIEGLAPDDTPLQLMQRMDPAAKESHLRDLLGGWGFPGPMAISPVGPFSGGEKSRLVLCMIAYRKPQLLVLDEPTNHLDAQSRDALTEALAQFDGALLLVSHDRFLINACTDQLMLVQQGGVSWFEGSMQDYLEQQDDTRTNTQPERTEGGNPANRKLLRQQAAQQRALAAKLTAGLDTRLKALDRELKATQTAIEALDRELIDPAVLADSNAVSDLVRKRAQQVQSLARIEDDWLGLSLERERLLNQPELQSSTEA